MVDVPEGIMPLFGKEIQLAQWGSVVPGARYFFAAHFPVVWARTRGVECIAVASFGQRRFCRKELVKVKRYVKQTTAFSGSSQSGG